MAVKGQSGEVVNREGAVPSERSFDELTRGLASGNVSRRRALKLVGGTLLGSVLASIPGVALIGRASPAAAQVAQADAGDAQAVAAGVAASSGCTPCVEGLQECCIVRWEPCDPPNPKGDRCANHYCRIATCMTEGIGNTGNAQPGALPDFGNTGNALSGALPEPQTTATTDGTAAAAG